MRSDVALHNIGKFFLKSADEEKDHAQKLIDYNHKRGGNTTYSDIKVSDAVITLHPITDAVITSHRAADAVLMSCRVGDVVMTSYDASDASMMPNQ